MENVPVAAPTGSIIDNEKEVLSQALITMTTNDFLNLMTEIVRKRGSEALTFLISGLEIMQTPSAFQKENETRLQPLAKALEKNPLSFYAEHRNVPAKEITRKDIIDWWSTLMQMASVLGYSPSGIDGVSRQTNLWKATANLAAKMQLNPALYRFLPPVLINYVSEVERVLSEINEPIAFLEILIGERYEDMLQFPKLIEAFSIIERNGSISRTTEDGILSIQLALLNK